MARSLKWSQVAGGLEDDYTFKNVPLIESEKSLSDLIANDTPAILLVMVRWCPYCKATFPIQDAAAAMTDTTFAAIDWDREIGHDLFQGQQMKFPTFVILGQNRPPRILGHLSQERADPETLKTALEAEIESVAGDQQGGKRRRRRRNSRRLRRTPRKNRSTQRRRRN